MPGKRFFSDQRLMQGRGLHFRWSSLNFRISELRHELSPSQQWYNWLQKAHGSWCGCWTNSSLFRCYCITFGLLSVTLSKFLPGQVSKSWTHYLEPAVEHHLWSATSHALTQSRSLGQPQFLGIFWAAQSICGFYWMQPSSSMVAYLKIMA